LSSTESTFVEAILAVVEPEGEAAAPDEVVGFGAGAKPLSGRGD